MLNVRNFPQIINFFKEYCYCYRETGEEIIIFCPYCDDAVRKPGRLRHGHLYISTLLFVFHCFRCGTSGHILKLLTDLKFPDSKILTDIKRIFPNYNFGSSIISIKKSSKDTIYKTVYKKWIYCDRNIRQNVINYLTKRFGKIELNWIDFLIFPGTTLLNNQSYPCVNFLNYNQRLCCQRITTNTNNVRYYIPKVSDNYYYFQPVDKITNVKNIVITEGPFDTISYFLFGGLAKNNTFYISALGKKHLSCLKWLLINGLMFNFNDVKIILVFDDDVKNPKKFLFFAKKILNKVNLFNISVIIEQAKYKDVDTFCIVRRF